VTHLCHWARGDVATQQTLGHPLEWQLRCTINIVECLDLK
jgi:hypothetical protein